MKGTAMDASARRHVDDRARALRLHGRKLVLHAQEDAAEVDGEGALPVLERDPLHGSRGAGDARIVDRAVDAAEGRDAVRDGGLDVGLARDVGLHAARDAALGLDLRDRLVGAALLAIAHDDARALAREQPGRRAPDAARGARHERDLSFDQARHRSAPRLGSDRTTRRRAARGPGQYGRRGAGCGPARGLRPSRQTPTARDGDRARRPATCRIPPSPGASSTRCSSTRATRWCRSTSRGCPRELAERGVEASAEALLRGEARGAAGAVARGRPAVADRGPRRVRLPPAVAPRRDRRRVARGGARSTTSSPISCRCCAHRARRIGCGRPCCRASRRRSSACRRWGCASSSSATRTGASRPVSSSRACAATSTSSWTRTTWGSRSRTRASTRPRSSAWTRRPTAPCTSATCITRTSKARARPASTRCCSTRSTTGERVDCERLPDVPALAQRIAVARRRG